MKKSLIFFILITAINCNDMKDTSGYADVNGMNMYYEIHGKGRPIILLHGGGSTIQTTFGRIIDDIAKDRKVIAVELQAHGHTSDRDKDLSFEQDADDVAELMKQLHIESADIFGFSNGATTAIQLAIRHPEKVRKVIAASGLFKKDGAFPGFWDMMQSATLKDMPQELKSAFMEINNDSSRLLVMHDRDLKRMRTFTDISDADLRSIKAPVLLTNGEHDVATHEHINEISRLIPNCQVMFFPGGHGDYLGEIAAPTRNDKEFPIMPALNEFLKD